MKKQAKILMGLPLSGKTNYINEHFPDWRVISADDLKEAHPEYNPAEAHKLHQWSVETAEKQLRVSVEDGTSFVLDSGSINNSYTVRILKHLRENDYHITLIHIRTPLEICLLRNEERERKVPRENIILKATKERKQKIRLTPMVDEVETVEYFTDQHIFIDMDGVLAGYSTLPKVDGKIDFVNSEVFLHLKPVMPVINRLRELEKQGHTLYILSATPNSFSVDEKQMWLDKHFYILPGRRFFVNSGRHKAEMLDNLTTYLKLDKRDVTLLDDMHATLEAVKMLHMKGIHISEFLAEYPEI